MRNYEALSVHNHEREVDTFVIDVILLRSINVSVIQRAILRGILGVL